MAAERTRYGTSTYKSYFHDESPFRRFFFLFVLGVSLVPRARGNSVARWTHGGTVDRQDHPINKECDLTCEKRNHTRDLLWFSGPADRRRSRKAAVDRQVRRPLDEGVRRPDRVFRV